MEQIVGGVRDHELTELIEVWHLLPAKERTLLLELARAFAPQEASSTH